MKITKAEVFMLGGRPEHGGASGVWRPVGCRIYTDEGIYGDGEAAVAYGNGAPGAYGMLCELSAKIIGKDPMNSDAVWEYLYRSTFWGQNGGPIFLRHCLQLILLCGISKESFLKFRYMCFSGEDIGTGCGLMPASFRQAGHPSVQRTIFIILNPRNLLIV